MLSFQDDDMGEFNELLLRIEVQQVMTFKVRSVVMHGYKGMYYFFQSSP